MTPRITGLVYGSIRHWFDVLLVLLGLVTALYPSSFRGFLRGTRSRVDFPQRPIINCGRGFYQAIVAPFITFILVLFLAVPVQISVIMWIFSALGSLRLTLVLIGLIDLAIGVQSIESFWTLGRRRQNSHCRRTR